MNRTSYALVIALVVALAAIGAIFLSSSRIAAPSDQALPNATSTSQDQEPADGTAGEPGGVASVKLAFLDTSGNGSGASRGCDNLVLEDYVIPTTQAPLTAALRKLFSIEDEQVGGSYNFIARTRATLAFDRAAVEDGVASVWLSGSLSGLAGVCDDPRAKIQIEETALQFPTVQSVQLYLNGEKTDLQPDAKGI